MLRYKSADDLFQLHVYKKGGSGPPGPPPPGSAPELGTVEGEADMETVSCAFSLLCLILYMSGWSEVENEQRSGCGE